MTKTQAEAPTVDTAAARAPGMVPNGMALAMMPYSVASRLATSWLEGVTHMNGEWARFVGERLEKDAEAQHKIMRCGSPIAAQSLQADFLHQVISDYLVEASRISSIGIRAAQDAGIKTSGSTST